MADIFIHETFTAKRARKACLTCRRRKIRCNVDAQGPPCSNCLTDGLAGCRTTESLRGKKPRSFLEKEAEKSADSTPTTAAQAPDSDRPADSESSSSEYALVSPTHTVGWLEETIEDFSDARLTTNPTTVRGMAFAPFWLPFLTRPSEWQTNLLSTHRLRPKLTNVSSIRS